MAIFLSVITWLIIGTILIVIGEFLNLRVDGPVDDYGESDLTLLTFCLLGIAVVPAQYVYMVYDQKTVRPIYKKIIKEGVKDWCLACLTCGIIYQFSFSTIFQGRDYGIFQMLFNIANLGFCYYFFGKKYRVH